MNASAEVRHLAHAPLQKSAFHWAESSADAVLKGDARDCALRVKQVLRQAGLTMAQVSALTSMRYGKKTPYFVPPTFLYKQRSGIAPHICQIVALSQVTGFRFADWMKVCGFDLKLILALQLQIHTERTAIVTPGHSFPACDSYPVPWSSRLQESSRRFLYAKIGSRDAVVYPTLVPGSIVRADRCYSPHVLDGVSADDRLWLVEHPGGLACCYVRRVDSEHVVLLPNRPPLSAWPLRLSREARILGLVDLQLRPREAVQFEPMCGPTGSESFSMAPHGDRRISFSKLLRVSRSRIGLTLRAAHKMTLRVAQLRRDRDYRIALGLLSDYEAMDRLPRHVAKIMTLCVVYGIDPWELMEAGGVHIDDSDKAPLFLHERKSDSRQSA